MLISVCCLFALFFDPQKYKGMMEKIDITATGVVDSIRNKMAVATVSNKGLMPSGVLSEFQGAYSVLLFETTSTPVSGSILQHQAECLAYITSPYHELVM